MDKIERKLIKGEMSYHIKRKTFRKRFKLDWMKSTNYMDIYLLIHNNNFKIFINYKKKSRLFCLGSRRPNLLTEFEYPVLNS